MAKKNNLFTLSYFRKRLKDENIDCKVLVKNFSSNDNRYWSVSIFEDLNIFCTCYKDDSACHFLFSDGNQNIKIDKGIKTESMNVILDFLKNINSIKENNNAEETINT